ncbi:hypothetical protein F4780DRAFT_545456 [Xylariomycetidae sp. FL0641]|nr:hypothetical protein F4780DRAFT_545456 [Xylariomycetidae sp. FL0641]
MSDKMSIDKKENSQEDQDESLVSSPENENGPSVPQETQPVKRKGGRKPIYATSEERKQRNRQAQAAFRERRTEYIKQLEDTIKVHESNLTNLQAAHRSAADECLMLRYKNSLLERILLEKGIDVQTELRAKTGSPGLGPTHMPQNMVQPPPVQRAILNRHHHSRRSTSSIAPKLEPGMTSLPPPTGLQQAVASPKNRPTPPHVASPTNPNPPYGNHLPASSPTDPEHTSMRPPMPLPPKPQMPQMPVMAPGGRQHMMPPHQQQPPPQQPQQQPQQQQQQQQPQQPSHQQQQQQPPGSGPRPPSFYPPPSFQNHFQQLEQEYDAPNDMMDEPEPETPGPGPYPSAYPVSQQSAMPMQPPTSNAPSQQPIAPSEHGTQTQGPGYPSMTQLLDPALDWDPFGLSASMAFPTQFSFDTSNMR